MNSGKGFGLKNLAEKNIGKIGSKIEDWKL
jgi:hypothetical protein